VRGSLLPDCPGDGARIEEWPLAVDKVRYQGDAVAVVLADSRDTARDAAELVEVEYEPLAVVVDGVEAVEHAAPVLHEKAGTNVAWHGYTTTATLTLRWSTPTTSSRLIGCTSIASRPRRSNATARWSTGTREVASST